MSTKILIIDDEPAIGRLLMYQLGGFGYQVSYVDDGLLALQRLDRERPDLVLLDVMMPMISGWDVCRQIRAVSPVPIIMLTAKSSEPDVVTGLSAGADDYVAKPFSMTHLQARIDAVLRRARAQGRVPERELVAEYTAPHTAKAPPSLATAEGIMVATAQATPQRLGQRLREMRLARGMSLNDAGAACKVRWEFLQAIEQENFSYVPRPQLRIALHAYAGFLGLNIRDVVPQTAAPPVAITSKLPYAVVGLILLVILSVLLALIMT